MENCGIFDFYSKLLNRCEYYHADVTMPGDGRPEIIKRCFAQKNAPRCVCGGDLSKCECEVGAAHESTPTTLSDVKGPAIYYAHHQWKYGTPIEEYEQALIRKYFPNATIINPATDLKQKDCNDETKIMAECLGLVIDSDIIVFSSMDGLLGAGVYAEVQTAQKAGKLVLYLYQDDLTTEFTTCRRGEGISDRICAYVEKEFR